jgi:hypothetical protein
MESWNGAFSVWVVKSGTCFESTCTAVDLGLIVSGLAFFIKMVFHFFSECAQCSFEGICPPSYIHAAVTFDVGEYASFVVPRT